MSDILKQLEEHVRNEGEIYLSIRNTTPVKFAVSRPGQSCGSSHTSLEEAIHHYLENYPLRSFDSVTGELDAGPLNYIAVKTGK